MSHDLIAELTGYQEELTAAEQRDRKERAKAVRAEITRVVDTAAQRIEQLLARAGNHEDAGEDLQAANARVEAKTLARAVIDAGHEDRLGESLQQLRGPGFETTEQNTPQETAEQKTPQETATSKERRSGRAASSGKDA